MFRAHKMTNVYVEYTEKSSELEYFEHVRQAWNRGHNVVTVVVKDGTAVPRTPYVAHFLSELPSGATFHEYVKPKTTRLREMLYSAVEKSELAFLMEAHDGLSAKIAEEAGFKALWASGLSISASLGVRDCNEASWSQVLQVLEFMTSSTSVPILVDGDTGYGNFNNARHYTKKLEQIGIAGVCYEDKLFPKTNSLMESGDQSLTSIEEFTGKIRACRDALTDKDFVIVARVEAFIAGIGFEEAYKRALAYEAAGADAILMHSRLKTSVEIDQFMTAWNTRERKIPVIIVPTNYYTTPTSHFIEMKVSGVIWANHSVRVAVKAIQKCCKSIYETKSLVDVNPDCVAVTELFRLQGDDELKEAEKRYF